MDKRDELLDHQISCAASYPKKEDIPEAAIITGSSLQGEDEQTCFKCVICGEEKDHFTDVFDHIVQHHPFGQTKKFLACGGCGIELGSEGALHQHTKWCHPLGREPLTAEKTALAEVRTIFRCSICQEAHTETVTETLHEMHVHLDAVHAKHGIGRIHNEKQQSQCDPTSLVFHSMRFRGPSTMKKEDTNGSGINMNLLPQSDFKGDEGLTHEPDYWHNRVTGWEPASVDEGCQHKEHHEELPSLDIDEVYDSIDPDVHMSDERENVQKQMENALDDQKTQATKTAGKTTYAFDISYLNRRQIGSLIGNEAKNAKTIQSLYGTRMEIRRVVLQGSEKYLLQLESSTCEGLEEAKVEVQKLIDSTQASAPRAPVPYSIDISLQKVF